MRRLLFTCLALLLAATTVPALAAPGAFAAGDGPAFATRHLAIPDVAHLQFEDDVAAKRQQPLRVAEPQPAGWNPAEDGTWTVRKDGSSVWRLRVNAPGAVFTSYHLADVRVPPGTQLQVRSVERQFVAGPYGWRELNQGNAFGTPAIPGQAAVLELVVPADPSFLPSFVIDTASYGYRDFRGFANLPVRPGFESAANTTIEKAAACEVDVACSAGNGWANEIRAVAQTYDGRYVCTGTLINNQRQDCRNLFLTAAHCVSRSRTASSLVLYWNFQNSSCNSGDAARVDSTTGTTLLATASASDFTLLEVNGSIPASFDVYYAGYDATPLPPLSATCIHHPAGDEKKISHEYDPLLDGGGQSGGWGADHWRIVGWDVGTTEGGSSGSAIFDADHQIVGQLHGGTAGCSGGWDEYGKLSSSWNFGLSGHLDPDGTNTLVLGGKDNSTCSGTGGPSCKAVGESCSTNGDCCSGNCWKKNSTCR